MPTSLRGTLPILCLSMVAVLVIFGAVAPGTVLGFSSAGETTADTSSSLFAQEASTQTVESNTTFIVELQPNGDAHWQVVEHFELTSDEDREAFEDLADNFESKSVAGADLGFATFQRAAELINGEVDRDLTVTNEERSSSVDLTSGTLTLSFTWENFARVDGDQLVLDDIFESGDTLWFEQLTGDQTLLIKAPDGFGFDDANVLPENGTLKWQGPTTFTAESLQAVLIGTGVDTTTPVPSPSPTEVPPPNNSSSSFGSFLFVMGAIGLLGVVVVVVVMMGGHDHLKTILMGTRTSDDETTDDSEPAPGSQETSQSAEPETASEPETDSEPDVELLSDEERVERLLEQNGGRMKQASIVKETGWSNAKVSQLLSAMEEDDRIDKLRIGRENLISFPEEDVTEIGDS
ncbi:helix-turn-helix transcriptional regulator [Halovenus rubra]|uniref:Helix-turn-helix transcriptional regulator n=2 Tax=Halovenus rubra TaxID=869890 RepID=A0ACC7DX63_9EURY|nr:hypothetical protein [Halovenus rubra]